jgi:hypothetical protein
VVERNPPRCQNNGTSSQRVAAMGARLPSATGCYSNDSGAIAQPRPNAAPSTMAVEEGR